MPYKGVVAVKLIFNSYRRNDYKNELSLIEGHGIQVPDLANPKACKSGVVEKKVPQNLEISKICVT